MRDDMPIIRDGLLRQAESLCRKLLPSGRRDGNRYVAHDPVQGDYDKTPALSVMLGGQKPGSWRAFRGGADNEKHDLLGLIAYVQRTDAKGAILWARDFLGLKTMSPAERAAMHQRAAEREVERKRDDERLRLRKIDAVQGLWRCGIGGPAHAPAEGRPPRDFTLPAVTADAPAAARPALAYFAARGVALDSVPNLAGFTFRFAPRLEWWKGASWRTQANGRSFKEAPGPFWPAVVTAARTAEGHVGAVHLTFLDIERPAKAPVGNEAKLVYGFQTGTVMELACGPIDLPFWLNREPGDVIVCEGIETGLALAIACPEARVWAAGSITNMGNAPVHLDCVGRVFLARDNNAGNATAQGQLDDTLEKLEASGKRVIVMASHVGDDFNDAMTGEE